MINTFFAIENLIFSATTRETTEDGYDYTVTASSKEGVVWTFDHRDNGGDAYDEITASFQGEDLFTLSYNELDGCDLISSTLDGRRLLKRLQKKFS